MRKGNRRAKRPARMPTLIAYHLNPEVSITERLAADSFSGGWATTAHFDVLADCRDLLMLSAAERDQQDALHICDVGREALESIKARHLATGRMGASGEELKALRALVDFSEDYWKRTSGDHFVKANAQLDRARGIGG